MAQEKVIAVDLVIDSGDSLKELKLVEDELKSIEDTIRKVNASDDKGLENQLKSLNKVVEDNNLTWSELGKTIEQYQNIALASGKESPIGQEAIRRAGELKSEMDNLTRSVDSLATNGQNLNTALQVSQGVVAGYTAVQSITALIGDENEELMEVMVRLQAAQGALASIEQVRFALEKDSLVVLKAKNIWTKAQAVATNLLAGATRKEALATVTATTATKGFTKALAGTGIGLIIVLLGTLIANFDKLKDGAITLHNWIMSLRDGFESLTGWMDYVAQAFAPLILAWQQITVALEHFGVIDDEVTRQQKENNEALIKDLQDRGKEIDELIIKQQELTDNTIKQLDREIALRKAQGKDVAELEKEKLSILEASALREFELAKQRLELFSQEIILRLKNNELTREQYEEQLEQFNELAKNLNNAKNAYLDASNAIQVYEANITTTLRKESVKRQEIKRKEREKELSDRQKQLEEDKAWIIKYNEETQALRDELKASQKQKDIEDQMQASLLSAQQGIQDFEDYKANEDAKEQYRNERIQKGFENSEHAITALSNLNDLFLQNDLKKAGNNEDLKERLRKESFERNKKLQYASAVIDGAKAITSVLAQPLDPISKGVLLTATITNSIAQLAKIKATNYQSSGTIGSVTGSLASGFSNATSNTTQDTQAQGLTTTDVTQLIEQNNNNQPVLVVDDFNKVNHQQEKIAMSASI